ncbi:hypothetical protein SLEP1_g45484 [Rubroshorea leprosula]|uniref:Uncharacterized protein n=1 Tax=Rubroshorea leprosula TaxID=152421 RepID=A0AAV5LJX2_9ROSI|nr:hypothetical protein SLEP1_g45484 [Rubroshorea leprosula]
MSQFLEIPTTKRVCDFMVHMCFTIDLKHFACIAEESTHKSPMFPRVSST